MSLLHRLPLLVCISYVEIVPSTLALILMPQLIRLLLSAAPLLTWDTAKKAQAVGSGICASVQIIPATPAVGSDTVHYLTLIARAR